MKKPALIPYVVTVAAALLLASCSGGGGGGGGVGNESASYTVGGSVNGLRGTGLVLRDNNAEDLAITADGAFTFATKVADGAGYTVTVKTQPSGPSQTCTVNNGTGTVAGANMTGISVTCSTNAYTVGGSVSGLAGAGLVLQNNNAEDLAITADGTFTFATKVADSAGYTVTVKSQPSGPSQTCTVNNGVGTIAGANAIGVSVTCSTNAYTVNAYTVGGSVTGLIGTGLVLQNNGAGDLVVAPGSTSFTFATALADGSGYNVTIKTQPAGQICVASNNTGTISGANVTGIAIVCPPWTKQMGVAGKSTTAAGVAVDTSGNVYVTGYTNGGLDGNTLTGASDFFLVKYDSSGNKVFAKQMGVAGKSTTATGVAIDSSGNYAYVTGYTNGGLYSTLTGTHDFFLVKYDSSGSTVKQMGVAGAETFAYGVAADSSGNVYVTGYTNGGLDGNTLTGTSDFFLVKYDSSGNKVFANQMGVAGASTTAYGITVDTGGHVYVTGATNGGLDVNSLSGSMDLFLIEYDSSGNKVGTAKQMGVAAKSTIATGVAVDSSGNVCVTGATNGGLDGNTLTGTEDFFFVKYDSLGNKVGTAKQMGVASVWTFANGVAVDSSGDAYVTGYTYGGLDGNTQTGTEDFFLVKYDSSGEKL